MRQYVSLASILAVLYLAAGGAASASDPWPMESGWTAAGTRVRVTAPTVTQAAAVGWVKEWTPDTLLLEVDPDRSTLPFPTASILRLETSQGRSGHAATGALVGLLTGMAIGIPVGQAVAEDSGGGGIADGATEGLVAWAGTAAAGTIVGAAVGALIKTERWKTVRP